MDYNASHKPSIKELEAEVERLLAVNAEYKRVGIEASNEVERLETFKTMYENAETEVLQLRSALEKYGVHKMNCASLLPVGIAVDKAQDCDCGLDKKRRKS